MCTRVCFQTSNRMCVQACVAAYIHACTMCTCVHFRAHVRASMCNGTHPCVHHEHMRALPSTCACKHVQRHTFMCASCAHIMCTCVCFRAHVRAHAFSCAHACASEHMCLQACAAAYTHACIMNTCVSFRAHVCASMCNGIPSCVHVQFHVHMRVLPSTCACKLVQRIHSRVHHVHMRELPSTCARKHV